VELRDVSHSRTDRAWVDEAVRRLDAEADRSADTHLYSFPLPPQWGVDLYLKGRGVAPHRQPQAPAGPQPRAVRPVQRVDR